MTGWLQRERIRFISAGVLAVTVVLLAISVVTARNGMTIFGPGLGADYAGFYVAGKILNEYGADRLYDLQLQSQIYHSLLPGIPAQIWLPFHAYPPFVAIFFRPLALLPYSWSYIVWLIISAVLYVAGFAFIWKARRALPSSERGIALLLALSFEPFIAENWASGQLSSVGFLCIALALYYVERGFPIMGGVALGLCLYKPTLLVLILPLLLIGRRFKMLFGFVVCALGLAAVCLLSLGKQSCLEYANMMIGHLQDATKGAAEFRDWKFVDLVSSIRLLLGGRSGLGRVITIVVFAVGFLRLAVDWWRSKGWGADAQRLLWAATLTGTLVLNIHIGIYDTVLVVIAALLVADQIYLNARSQPASLPMSFKVWLLLLYVVPWFSQEIARITHFQLYTIILAGFAVYQFGLAGVLRFRLQSHA